MKERECVYFNFNISTKFDLLIPMEHFKKHKWAKMPIHEIAQCLNCSVSLHQLHVLSCNVVSCVDVNRMVKAISMVYRHTLLRTMI